MNARLRYWFPHFVHSTGHLKISVTSVAFSPAAVYKLPLAIRNGIIQAFGHSLHVVFLCAAPVALLTFPIILLLKQLPLRSNAYVGSTAAMAEGAAEVLAEQGAPDDLEDASDRHDEDSGPLGTHDADSPTPVGG
jgi:hypothetical protein